MLINSREAFLIAYNERVPNWKKITKANLLNDKSLDKIILSIANFIANNNLDPKKLVDSIVDHYFAKKKRYPNIFLFKGNVALSIYKNYQLAQGIDLTETQKIIVSVKKSKILLKNLEKNGIIYNKGVELLKNTGKVDFYFLLAHGIREGIPKQIIEAWEKSDELKNLVLNTILS
jgi:hypothetical protein